MRNAVAGCRSPRLGLHTENEGLGRLSGYVTPEGGAGQASCRAGKGLCPRSLGRSAANPVSCFPAPWGSSHRLESQGHLGPRAIPTEAVVELGQTWQTALCLEVGPVRQGPAWVPRFRAVQSGLGPLTPAPRLSPACSPPTSARGVADPRHCLQCLTLHPAALPCPARCAQATRPLAPHPPTLSPSLACGAGLCTCLLQQTRAVDSAACQPLARRGLGSEQASSGRAVAADPSRGVSDDSGAGPICMSALDRPSARSVFTGAPWGPAGQGLQKTLDGVPVLQAVSLRL